MYILEAEDTQASELHPALSRRAEQYEVDRNLRFSLLAGDHYSKFCLSRTITV